MKTSTQIYLGIILSRILEGRTEESAYDKETLLVSEDELYFEK